MRDKSIGPIAEALATNTTLTTLALGENGLTNISAAHIGNALTLNTTLTSIDMTQSRLSKVGFQHIIDGILINPSLTAFKWYCSRTQMSQNSKVSALIERNTHNTTQRDLSLFVELLTKLGESLASSDY